MLCDELKPSVSRRETTVSAFSSEQEETENLIKSEDRRIDSKLYIDVLPLCRTDRLDYFYPTAYIGLYIF